MDKIINKFKDKSRHHKKFINFLYPELQIIKNANILEFGVSEKAMSTSLFLEYSKNNNCKLFSVDSVDYSTKFDDPDWRFLHSRDDNFSYIFKNIPKLFKLILLDTIHEADHVKKILFKYYDFLEVNNCFFIDDISWLPYLKSSEKNKFNAEINNFETFKIILDIYYANRENFDLEFNFEGTGMCKIKKKNSNRLNEPKKIKSRYFSIKNLIRKILKK